MFDARSFAARAAQSLQDPRVAAYAAERIADQLVAYNRDLTAFRPLLVATARAVVASEPFRAAFRRSAETAHTMALSGRAEQVYLSLPDASVLWRAMLPRADPALAARLPKDLGTVIAGPAPEAIGRHALAAVRLGRRARWSSVVLLALGGLSFLAGVTVPSDRRRAVLRGGLALAAAALVLFTVPTAGRMAARLIEPDGGIQPLLAGLWNAFAGGLQVWALALGGVGLVIAAAASSLASHVEIEIAGRRAWDALQRPARTPHGEAGRGAALVLVGLFAVLAPQPFLRLLTVLAGALMAFEGLRELFALVAPRIESRGLAVPESAAEPRDRLRHGLLAALALVLVAAAIAFLRSPRATPLPRIVSACNGDAALCGRRLDEVVFPGAHNAMAAADVPGWMFPNQERGIREQLQLGIRALLIDVHHGVPVQGRVKTEIADEEAVGRKFERAMGREGLEAALRIRNRLVGAPQGPRALYLCHGFCELGAQPLSPALQGIHDFLVEHPGEVLLIVVEDADVQPLALARAFEESGLVRFVYRGPAGPPWPTLREMVDADQRVLVLAENNSAGVPWLHRAYDVMQETPFSFRSPDQLSCAAHRGGEGKSLFLMNHWIDSAPAPRPSVAEVMNVREFLVDRARRCFLERGRLPNILAVDFAGTGDVTGAAAELNRLRFAVAAPASPGF